MVAWEPNFKHAGDSLCLQAAWHLGGNIRDWDIMRHEISIIIHVAGWMTIYGNWVKNTQILVKECSLHSFQQGPTESCRRMRSAAWVPHPWGIIFGAWPGAWARCLTSTGLAIGRGGLNGLLKLTPQFTWKTLSLNRQRHWDRCHNFNSWEWVEEDDHGMMICRQKMR